MSPTLTNARVTPMLTSSSTTPISFQFRRIEVPLEVTETFIPASLKALSTIDAKSETDVVAVVVTVIVRAPISNMYSALASKLLTSIV